MVASHYALAESEQTWVRHKFNPYGGQHDYYICEGLDDDMERERRNALVVPNWVLRRLPKIPCTPRLALMNARPTKERAFDHAGSSRALEILGWPLFQKAIAPTMVMRTWMNVPEISHMRFWGPMRSPILPTNAPALKAMREHNAC